MSRPKRGLVQSTVNQTTSHSKDEEPPQKIVKRGGVLDMTVGVSRLHSGLRHVPRPALKTPAELWFDQYVYDWKKEPPVEPAECQSNEVCVNEPALLADEVQKWLLPHRKSEGCAWVVDLRFGSLRGGWLAFYKQHLPLCAVPLLLREKSLRESGRAIFERASLRPRSASQARESLHFLAARTESKFTCKSMRSLLLQLRIEAGAPAVVFLGWSMYEEKAVEVELRDALAAAAVCDGESMFLLSFPEKPTRAQQLALFLFSSCFAQWRLFSFEASRDEGTRRRLLFGGKGLLASWAAFLSAEICILSKESLPASVWLEAALRSTGLSLSVFWSWKAKWRQMHYGQKIRLLCEARGDQTRRNVRVPSLGLALDKSTFQEVTVRKWLRRRLPSGALVEDLLYRWVEDGLSSLVKRSFLWSDQEYTWESFCPTQPVEKPTTKWFSRLATKLHKNRPLPPHTFLLLENSCVAVDLLLFPELNTELQLQWTRSQRLAFVKSSILPAQKLRKKVLAPDSAEQPLNIEKLGTASEEKGWQNSLPAMITKQQQNI